MQPEKVPEVLRTSINFKIIALFFVAAIGFQIFLNFTEETEQIEEGIAFLSMSTPLIVAGGSAFIAMRYGLSKVFGKSYLIFAIGYFVLFLAEGTYYAYDVIYGIDPYPSIADVFFFAFYIGVSLHMAINFRFFKTKIPLKYKALFIAIPVAIFSIYSYASLIEFEEPDFDYYYGIIFVAGASVILSLAAMGTIVFRGGVLGVTWMLLLIGILIFTIGDVWYYWLEVVGEYSLLHPVNLLWYIPDGIVIYALYKHSKAI